MSTEEQTEARAQRVAAAAVQWRQELADTGGRNPLLWHRDSPIGVLDLTVAHPSGTAKLLAGARTRLSELVREPHAYAEAHARAVAVRHKARELAEERGLRTCFLSVGTATWQIAGAAAPPRAGVLLRSCRIEPVDASYRDLVLSTGPDITFNGALAHYLREQQGLDLDPTWIASLAQGTHGFDARPSFDALEEMCADLPGFKIAPQVVLSTYPWSKLGMVADVVAQEEQLGEHPLIAALAGDPVARRELAGARERLPETLAAEHDPLGGLVLDADADQQRVLRAVRAGASVVVQGAPGNGKTQTVANLAASLAGEGKRVLVVAEKSAALHALRRRLDAVGLGELVLPLADDAIAAQRAAGLVLSSLDEVTGEVDTTDLQRVTREQQDAQRRADAAFATLGADAAQVHQVRAPWGTSVHAAEQELARLAARPHPPVSRVRLDPAQLSVEGQEEMHRQAEALAGAARAGAWAGGPDDPWYDARVTSEEAAASALTAARRLGGEELAAARRTLEESAASVGLPPARTVDGWRELVDLLDDALVTLDMFTPAVFETPLDDLVAATAEGQDRDEDARDMGAFTRSKLRRAARRLLRPGQPPADLHAPLRRARELRQRWERLGGRAARPEAIADLAPASAALERLDADVSTLQAALTPREDRAALDHLPLDELAALAATLVERRDRLAVVPTVRATLEGARAVGLGPLVADLARRSIPADDVPAMTSFVWHASLLDAVRAERSASPEELRTAWRTFLREDRAAVRAQAKVVRLGCLQRAHDLLSRAPAEIERLRARFAAVTRPEELRAAWRSGGGVVPTVRPITVASPLVLGSVLPLGRLFDVVIIHQAGQVEVAHALSTLLRGRQVVLVGDAQQTGPREFVAVADGRAERRLAKGARTGRPRSVLDAAAELLPVLRLDRHYRSLDERLVTAIEQRVYPGAMLTSPGTLTVPPVLVEEVRAGDRARAQQADRVIELVLDHARRRPHLSLGVVTFSQARAEELDAALRAVIARSHDLAGSFREGAAEAFFIKPAHLVAGDVRDAVIVDLEGITDDQPGPEGVLAGAEGLRLVTTALTCSRRRLQLVAVEGLLDGADPTSARGLVAAVGRPAAPPEPSGELAPVLEDLASRLRKEQLTVATRYGRGAEAVELAVFDPDQPSHPLLAVLTDAPWGDRTEIRETGEAAAWRLASWGRDWERLRTEQLMRLGWTPLRIWTTELFADPARDVARILNTARQASSQRAKRLRAERASR